MQYSGTRNRKFSGFLEESESFFLIPLFSAALTFPNRFTRLSRRVVWSIKAGSCRWSTANYKKSKLKVEFLWIGEFLESLKIGFDLFILYSPLTWFCSTFHYYCRTFFKSMILGSEVFIYKYSQKDPRRGFEFEMQLLTVLTNLHFLIAAGFTQVHPYGLMHFHDDSSGIIEDKRKTDNVYVELAQQKSCRRGQMRR